MSKFCRCEFVEALEDVPGAHSDSYEVITEDGTKEFALDLEVCVGKVHLQTSSPPEQGAGPCLRMQSSDMTGFEQCQDCM
eukprot:Skav228881  [mRNA]  locus=scaffold2395:191724:192748:+ [translate_table: standard]